MIEASYLPLALSDEGYINEDGIVTVKQSEPAKPGDGNGLMQTGLLYVIRAVHGCFTQYDADKLEKIRASCQRDGYAMLWRSPWKKNADDDQQHDDYRTILPALAFARSPFPKAFLAHAEHYDWSFDIQRPEMFNLKYYFERFLDFPPLVRMCAGYVDSRIKVSPLQRLIMAGSIILDALRIENADRNIRSYCQIAIAREQSGLCKTASLLWFRRIRKRYGTTGKSFAEYFGGNHPLCRGDWI